MAAKQQRKVLCLRDRGVHVYGVEMPLGQDVTLAPNHNRKYPTSMDVLHDGTLVGHVAGEHAALIFNLVHEQKIVVFGEITSAKAWSRRARGFEYGSDLIIFF